MPSTLLQSELPGLDLIHRGKVRDVYALPDNELLIVATDRLTLAHGRVAGERLLNRPAATRPDAVFAANDLLALGLLQAITTTRSLRVPDDIALIGYDDIDFAAGAAVPLSSVAQPRFELGRLAMDLLHPGGGNGSAGGRGCLQPVPHHHGGRVPVVEISARGSAARPRTRRSRGRRVIGYGCRGHAAPCR